MVYLTVIITSGIGIVALLLSRSVLRRRNVRRLVQTVKRGFSSAEQRNAKFLPDAPLMRSAAKSPRTRAIELQQVRTLLRDAERALANRNAHVAERCLIQALTMKADDRDIQRTLADLYLDTSREKKAEALYREMLQHGEEAALCAKLGLACERQRNITDAAAAYCQAQKLEPENTEYCFDCGRMCLHIGDLDHAAELLEKVTKRNGRNKEALQLLAECYEKMGEAGKAHDTYSKMNKLDPRDQRVREKMSTLTATL